MKLDVNIGRTANFIDSHITTAPLLEGGIPPFSSIEFSINALCTRRCVFCPRVDEKAFPNINSHLSLDLFKKIMDDLASINYIGRVSISGFGEPLLTKNIHEYIAYAKKKCPGALFEIVTNGDVLTDDVFKRLFDAGLDCLKISLYGGPHQIPKFEKMMKDHGLTEKEVLIRKRYLPPEKNYGLTISNRAGAITLENINVKPLDEPLNRPCYLPLYDMIIDYDGLVVICSNDWFKEAVVGDLNKESIIDVWKSDAFNAIRRKLVNNNRNCIPCKKCDTNGTYNGEKHFLAWKEYFEKNK